jgi:hypothetical protein
MTGEKCAQSNKGALGVTGTALCHPRLALQGHSVTLNEVKGLASWPRHRPARDGILRSAQNDRGGAQNDRRRRADQQEGARSDVGRAIRYLQNGQVRRVTEIGAGLVRAWCVAGRGSTIRGTRAARTATGTSQTTGTTMWGFVWWCP